MADGGGEVRVRLELRVGGDMRAACALTTQAAAAAPAASASAAAAAASAAAAAPPEPSPARAKRRRSQTRQLEILRDFLGKGTRDTAANRMWASREEQKFAARNSREGKAYGCRCHGVCSRRAPELWCGCCEKFFHVQCERLQLSPREFDKLRESYLCTGCERAQLEAAGVDVLAQAACAYECRWCAKVFTTERGILMHAVRCPRKPEERPWSCACKGVNSNAGGAQCAECSNFFHPKCRANSRPAWVELEPTDDEARLCDACLRARREDASGTTDLLGRRAARPIACAQQMVKEDGRLPFISCADEFGTLANGRVFVRESGLAQAGLGLFAGEPFEGGEIITAYSGPLLFKEEVEASRGLDQSYMVRIPGSGGQLIDGRQFALELRANAANPAADGRHYPLPGAAAWELGAASMANDPRCQPMYNARLCFKTPKGTHRDIQQLVPMRAYLTATQRINEGDEIFYNYGSDKPFEALARQQQQGQGQLGEAQGGGGADAGAPRGKRARSAPKPKSRRARPFRIVAAEPAPPAERRAEDDAEASERAAKRSSQAAARSARAHDRKRKALLEHSDGGGLSGALVAASLLHPDGRAPVCPVCAAQLQLGLDEQNAHIEACLRARHDFSLSDLLRSPARQQSAAAAAGEIAISAADEIAISAAGAQPEAAAAAEYAPAGAAQPAPPHGPHGAGAEAAAEPVETPGGGPWARAAAAPAAAVAAPTSAAPPPGATTVPAAASPAAACAAEGRPPPGSPGLGLATAACEWRASPGLGLADLMSLVPSPAAAQHGGAAPLKGAAQQAQQQLPPRQLVPLGDQQLQQSSRQP